MISVIVPVYNVEQYVSKCIQSIISQEYTELEIILVDDGSTDESGNICDDFSKKDSRIKVIHKENGGAADSRNAGLAVSKGDYIGFVDSDDRISPKMYSRLYSVIVENKCDIVECRFFKTTNIDVTLDDPITEPVIFNSEEAVFEIIQESRLTQTPVNKLYTRKAALSEPFLKGVYSEDEFWTYKIYGECKKTAFIDERLYYYYQRKGSKINSDFNIKRLDSLQALFERIEYTKKRFPSLVPYARKTYMGNCFYFYQRLCNSDYDKKTVKKLKKEIHKSYCEQSKKPYIRSSNLKPRMWHALFKKFPNSVCFIRNLFGIGL